MQIIYELSWLWTLLGIALAAAAVCVGAAALIARASQKRLGKNTAVLIGVLHFGEPVTAAGIAGVVLSGAAVTIVVTQGGKPAGNV